MIIPQQASFNQKIDFENPYKIELYIKREDVLHNEISGNKFRKLKYNLIEAKELGFTKLLTFGGAYSNHIAAVAAAGRDYGFETIGIIRGEELQGKYLENPTLKKAFENGMQFSFVSRTQYRDKTNPDFLVELKQQFGGSYVIPEGGTNEFAVKGCEEILTADDELFDFICCAVGTGGTISGIINSLQPHQWDLVTGYHFGGYAKINEQLKQFMSQFYKKYLITLDPIYTSKMFFGVIDLISKGYFKPHSKILLIHTGGLQGLQSNIAEL